MSVSSVLFNKISSRKINILLSSKPLSEQGLQIHFKKNLIAFIKDQNQKAG